LRATLKILSLAILVLALLVGLAPFTGLGTQFILQQLSRIAPIEVEYSSGSLFGELQIASIHLEMEALKLTVNKLESEVNVRCLWHSEICFENLRAAKVGLLISDTSVDGAISDSGDSGSATPFEFPVAVKSLLFELALLEVNWPTGSWRSEQAKASFVVSKSRIDIVSLSVQQSLLSLPGDENKMADDTIMILPELRLPFDLRLVQANLMDTQFDVGGQVHRVDRIELAGSWLLQQLRIKRGVLHSAALGTANIQGQVSTSEDWPLTSMVDVQIAEPSIWRYLHNRSFELQLGGDLRELLVQGVSTDDLGIEFDGAIATLDPSLAYSASLAKHGTGGLLPKVLPDLPEWLPEIELLSPLQVSSSGNLSEQSLQLYSTLTGLGYADTQLLITAQRTGENIRVDELTLSDSRSRELLAIRGDINLGREALTISLDLESSGMQLPDTSSGIAGTVGGQMSLSARIEDNSWTAQLAQVDLHGEVNELPASISGDIGLSSARFITSGMLVAEVNGAHIDLAIARQTGGGAGQLKLAIDELSRWRSDLHGKVELFAVISEGQDILQFDGQLEAFDGWGVSLARSTLQGQCELNDMLPYSVQVAASDTKIFEYEIEDIGLALWGDRKAQQAVLTTSGDVTGELKLAGKFLADEWQGRLSPATVTTPFGSWQLERELMLSSSGTDTLKIAAHCWATSDTRLCSEQDLMIGSTGEVELNLNGGMGFLSNLFLPGMSASGKISAQLGMSWSPAKPLKFLLDAHSENGQLTRRYSKEASATLAWDSANLKLVQDELSESLRIHVGLARGDGGNIQADLVLPAGATAELSGDVSFREFQLAPLAPLMPSLAEIGGVIDGAFSVEGSRESPKLLGIARLADGHMAVLGNPTTVDNLAIEIELAGDDAQISGAGLAGGGAFEFEGALTLQPELALQLTLKGGPHSLLLPPASEAEITENLNIDVRKGLLDISGEIVVVEGRLEPDQLPDGVVGISGDVVEVNYSGEVVDEKQAFNSRLDIQINILDSFQLNAKEFKARLGGDLRLLQDAGKPVQLFGNLQVAGGEVRAYGQRLKIKQGTVAFSGDPDNPELNLRAERDIPLKQIRVGVTVRGTAESPELQIYSDPGLPQSETLSYLIRGRGLDAGPSADGTALALSLGTSVVNRSSVISELNKLPGISNVEFGSTGSADDTAATLGGYVGERIYLSYGVGIYEPINVLTARFFLQSRLWVEVVSRLENSIDIYYSFDIE
jgi:autotransporter translocation and assembly factor TamB